MRCKNEIEWLQLYIAENVVYFGHNSLIADRWMNLCDNRPY